MNNLPSIPPEALAERTEETLRDLADPERAVFSQRYFKEPVLLYGVDAPTTHGIVWEIAREMRDVWSVDDAVRFCDRMSANMHSEARAIGYLVVGKFVKNAGPELLGPVRRWLEDSCGNWALVDTLAPAILSPLVDAHQDLIPVVVEWTGSPSLWVRRGTVVAFVSHARKGWHLGTAYTIADRLLGDSEYLIHKAVGWLLREAGKTDMPRLRDYLLDRGPSIPRTTLRYAIERFPKEERKALLAATKG